jgi:7-cyano-7-deazaguanine reductase
MTDLAASPLGHVTTYADRYDPGLLFPVERAPLRAELPPGPLARMRGADLWNAYELSWLDRGGKPQVAIGAFTVPAESPRIVESKSVKLYLTAFNQTHFDSAEDVRATIARDLAATTGADASVALTLPENFAALPYAELAGECLDALPLAAAADDALVPAALTAGGAPVVETLFTRLFRSVCPVTGQPDYASVQLEYRGPRIERIGLLRYLVSFRRQPGFHEHCVERIFADVAERCQPEALTVYARFTRRGGVDINPWRTNTDPMPPANARTARQ